MFLATHADYIFKNGGQQQLLSSPFVAFSQKTTN